MILESQIRALDTAISNLDRQITLSKESKVDTAFKKSWRGFTSRWQIQRDSWLGSAASRKIGFNESRYNDFQTAFGKWQTDFQSRISGPALPPPIAIKPTVKPSITSSLFGDLFEGSGTVLVIAACIVGGFIYLSKRRK